MAYGSGSIYRRGRIWWISYMLQGVQQNESSKSENREVAADLLRTRMGELVANRAIATSVRALTVPDLLAQLEERYIEEDRLSLADLRGKVAFLTEQFKGIRAADFGTAHIQRFRNSMKRRKRSNGTINRYINVLRRAFKLAAQHDPPLVGRVPFFERLDEDNVRTGFISDSQYQEIRSWLPEHLKGLLIFGYHLGMRKTALKNLLRTDVDWPNRIIRADAPSRAKKLGRVLPIYGDMLPWLEMQMSAWPATPRCRWIFHDQDGARIGDFRKAWASACKAAGVPGLLFHDLRRSAVRNMERAGVPRSQAMAITGHKTESIYRRYAIVNEQDIKAAGAKLERRLQSSLTDETTAKSTAIGNQTSAKC